MELWFVHELSYHLYGGDSGIVHWLDKEDVPAVVANVATDESTIVFRLQFTLLQ